MNIAIIGAGNVGIALGSNFARKGHRIFFGVRNPGKEDYAELKRNAQFEFHTVQAATEKAEVIFLAVPWSEALNAAKMISSPNKKIIVDTTNPLKPQLAGLFHDEGKSGAEQIAALVPGAHVIKCFNQTGAENMENPSVYQPKPVMFAAGDDDAAKARVLELAREAGFEARDAGELSAAMHLEHLAFFWIHLAYGVGAGRSFAFGLLTCRA